jgi:hypothetical protein
VRTRNLNDPNHWRDRAARMRSLASTAINQEAFDLISDLAKDFERLADQVQKREDGATPYEHDRNLPPRHQAHVR